MIFLLLQKFEAEGNLRMSDNNKDIMRMFLGCNLLTPKGLSQSMLLLWMTSNGL